MSYKTYFDLCNEILQELFYEKVEAFEELDDLTEGQKIKSMLNDSLLYICNNENTPWRFRDTDKILSLATGIKKYPNVNGYIDYIRYIDTPIVLQYDESHKYLPYDMQGMPTEYWIDDNYIIFNFTPDDGQNGRLLKIKYVTNDFAKDECGVLKPLMEEATDEPIIPLHHRAILKWDVCSKFRASVNDSKAVYYRNQFKEAYRALLMDNKRSDDYPNILDIMPNRMNSVDSRIRAFYLPQTAYKGKRIK